jgi:tetratricopeptide (TPR) repeat protein
MSQSPYLYKDEVYKAFKALERASYRDIIDYYESNKYKISILDIEQYFEIICTYAIALFELGMYRRYLDMSSEILELSISHNIYTYENEDIYSSTLFRKAASHYNLREKQEAETTIRQLLIIHPENEDALAFYYRIRLNKKEASGLTRAASIVLLLTSALVISAELLVIRPFYPEWTIGIEWGRNTLFSVGLSCYLVGEIYHRIALSWKIKQETRLWARAKKQKQKS